MSAVSCPGLTRCTCKLQRISASIVISIPKGHSKAATVIDVTLYLLPVAVASMFLSAFPEASPASFATLCTPTLPTPYPHHRHRRIVG
jgi:hypothetical protein